MEMKFYRYETNAAANDFRDDDDFFVISGYDVSVSLEKFDLVKETPKGYWITYDYVGWTSSWKKWIPKESKKRYAYPTKQEALNSFLIRKKKRIEHLTRDLKNETIALEIAAQIKI